MNAVRALQRFSRRPGSALQDLVRRAGWIVERYPGEESLSGHLRRLFTQYGVECVLDVGANRGQFGAMLRRSGYAGRIISFEPVPEAFDELSAKILSDEGWEARRLALGNRAGLLPLNITASTSVSSFLTPTAQYAASYAGGRVQRVEDVEVARLDGIFDDLVAGGRVFLKVDTQGYDLAVIEGATGCLDHVVGVQIEMSVMPIYEGVTSYIDAFRFMHDRGFSPSGVFSVVRDECLRVYEFDGVFVRARQIGATITPDPGQRVEEPSTDRDRWS